MDKLKSNFHAPLQQVLVQVSKTKNIHNNMLLIHSMLISAELNVKCSFNQLLERNIEYENIQWLWLKTFFPHTSLPCENKTWDKRILEYYETVCKIGWQKSRLDEVAKLSVLNEASLHYKEFHIIKFQRINLNYNSSNISGKLMEFSKESKSNRI